MLSYDIQSKILSSMNLWELYGMEEFMNAKNDKIYEMCYDRYKNDLSFHRENWNNKIYKGPMDILNRIKDKKKEIAINL